MEKDLSQRFELLRFPLIIGIVYIHAYESTVPLNGVLAGSVHSGYFSVLVREYFSQTISRVSVPLFFFLAGFFFFYKFRLTKEEYRSKIERRVHSLLIPFLFWNLSTLILIAIAQNLSVTSGYFSGTNLPIRRYGIFEFFNAIFGLNREPIAFQFWFIRDLMLMVLFVPLLDFLIRFLPIIYLPLAFSFWYFNYPTIYIPSTIAVCFFSFGAFFARKDFDFRRLDVFGNKILLLYFCISIADVLTKNEWWNPQLHRMGIVIGLWSAFYVTRIIKARNRLCAIMVKLSSATFFVYAFHEPLLTILRKIIFKAFNPTSDSFVITLYFLLPFCVIVASVVTYNFIERYFPRTTKFICGGR